MTTVIGILILVCALFLVAAVLLQSSKNHRMSGVVSGGAETFFGKQKGKTIDAKLSKATAVIAAVFALLVLALYLVNAGNQTSAVDNNVVNNNNVITDTTSGTETENTETEGTETEAEGTEAEGAEAEGAEAGSTEGTEATTEGEAAAE